jgi:DNA mismatch endonuclease, patch repair protein
VDTLTWAHRSWNMSRIKGCNTAPECRVRSILHKMGFRFSLHRKDLPGKPDIALRRYKSVVFVHGCFWHRHKGCKDATLPKTRRIFWRSKLTRNAIRDKMKYAALRTMGWGVIVVWECEIGKSRILALRLRRLLEKNISSPRVLRS